MFSVVIPLFNKEKYIRRTLDSVRSQTISCFEVIIVDDGSTDDGPSIVENEYPEFTLIRQENRGVSAARNAGIRASNHKYIVFLDADDAWSKNFLSSLYNTLKLNSNIKIIGTSYTRNIHLLENDTENLKLKIIRNYFDIALKNTLFFTSAVAVRRDFFDTNEGFDTSLTRGEDLDVWFRAILSGGDIAYIYNKLSYYSNEDDNAITNRNFPIYQSLLSKIYSNSYNEYASENTRFSNFRSNYVYINLYKYWFMNNKSFNEKEIFNSIEFRNSTLDLIYSLPCFIMKPLINYSFSNKLIRKTFFYLIQIKHKRLP